MEVEVTAVLGERLEVVEGVEAFAVLGERLEVEASEIVVEGEMKGVEAFAVEVTAVLGEMKGVEAFAVVEIVVEVTAVLGGR